MTLTRTSPRVFAEGLDHPEGLAAAPDGSLWAGGEEGQIYSVDAAGVVTEMHRTGGFSGGLAFDRDGTAIVCSTPGRILRVSRSSWEVFADQASGIPLRVPNFPVFGPDGTLYVSDSGSWDASDGVIFAFDPQGRGEVFHPGPFHYPNGLAIDAAGDYLYVVQSALHNIVRLRIVDGHRAAIEAACPPGSLRWVPDGIAFDASGALLVTTYGSSRIYRMRPTRRPEVLVEDRCGIVLNRPTNCAFGGPAFDQLFIANLGGRQLSVLDVDVPGQPLFGGPR